MDMSAEAFGIKLQPLTFSRRVWGFVSRNTPGDGWLYRALDLQVPYRVADTTVGANLVHLASLKSDCTKIFGIGKQDSGQQHGDFLVNGAYPFADLHPTTAERFLNEAETYVRAISFGLDEPHTEVSFELSDELPTQRIAFQSWALFGVTAETVGGKIELTIDWPDGERPGERKPPIGQIDTLLSGLLLWWLGAFHDYQVELKQTIKQQRAEGQLVSQFDRMVTLDVGQSFTPFGGGHHFPDSRLQLSAKDTELPVHLELELVLKAFRQQLLEQVPSLAE